MTEPRWASGDRVVHTARPEWGVGKVLSATNLREDGKDIQRLTIRFDRAGTKTLSTAVAKLAQADSIPVEVLARAEPGDGPLLAPAATRADLTTLPESSTDPFLSLARRIDATISLYRFGGQGGSLLDWAAAQTGLADPLSAFSRHELEEGFAKFRTALDSHLRKLVLDAARQEPATLAGLGPKMPPEIRDMLTRALTQR